jgi:hypothetical protein
VQRLTATAPPTEKFRNLIFMSKNITLEIAEEYPNITYSIKAGELLEMFRCVVSEVVNQAEQQRKAQPEQYLTRKQTAEMLDVDLSTLWRWNNEKYLCPVEIGGKRKYKLSEVNKILRKGETE